MFGAQFAKAAGARVIATTSSAEKAEKYKTAVGVDDVVNYRETPEWSEEVLKLTGGKGVEHVLEVGALSLEHFAKDTANTSV
jgi:NADPH:quinone reductase-like Zn-dependent oxidoreductase